MREKRKDPEPDEPLGPEYLVQGGLKTDFPRVLTRERFEPSKPVNPSQGYPYDVIDNVPVWLDKDMNLRDKTGKIVRYAAEDPILREEAMRLGQGSYPELVAQIREGEKLGVESLVPGGLETPYPRTNPRIKILTEPSLKDLREERRELKEKIERYESGTIEGIPEEEESDWQALYLDDKDRLKEIEGQIKEMSKGGKLAGKSAKILNRLSERFDLSDEKDLARVSATLTRLGNLQKSGIDKLKGRKIDSLKKKIGLAKSEIELNKMLKDISSKEREMKREQTEAKRLIAKYYMELPPTGVKADLEIKAAEALKKADYFIGLKTDKERQSAKNMALHNAWSDYAREILKGKNPAQPDAAQIRKSASENYSEMLRDIAADERENRKYERQEAKAAAKEAAKKAKQAARKEAKKQEKKGGSRSRGLTQRSSPQGGPPKR